MAEEDLRSVLDRIDRSVAIVRGYHKVTEPPGRARREGLTQRVAFVLDSFRRNCVDLYFDAELFFELAAGAAQALDAGRVEVISGGGEPPTDLETARARTLARPETEREPPERIVFQDERQQLLGIAESECWALVGGPAPYADSYTLSLYTKNERFGELVLMCDAVCRRLHATLTAIYEGEARSKR